MASVSADPRQIELARLPDATLPSLAMAGLLLEAIGAPRIRQIRSADEHLALKGTLWRLLIHAKREAFGADIPAMAGQSKRKTKTKR